MEFVIDSKSFDKIVAPCTRSDEGSRMSIFKAYDIRGIYGEQLNDELAYNIGRAFATFLQPKTVIVGRDMRPHSDPLFAELARGLTELGADVIDIGVCSTPMNYYANGKLGADAGIMITASHNPGPYNGFKLCRDQAIPISGATGIKEVEAIILENRFADPVAADARGTIRKKDVMPGYRAHIQSFAEITRPVHIAVDFANAMGIVEAEVFEGLPITQERLFDDLDGNFPNHEANPLDTETFEDVCNLVASGEFDFGIAFDGDADRVGFCDETGEVVSMDKITALIATSLLAKEKGIVFYDLRSSWACKEVIEENGGTPAMSRVGHSFIKAQIREAKAIFAGELSGHYYFRENYYTESSALAVILIANLVSQSGKKLSELVAPLNRYHASGEINSKVADTDVVFERLESEYGTQGVNMFHLDGLSIEFEDWWFNVRKSNTEPLIRLNIEASTAEDMATRRDELLAIIRA